MLKTKNILYRGGKNDAYPKKKEEQMINIYVS